MSHEGKRKRMGKRLPKQTVAQAYILIRVPPLMAISREMLLENIEKDIEAAAEEHDFHFSHYSRRASPVRTLKFLLQRRLLTERNGNISRNERSEKYLAGLPEAVSDLVDGLPINDPLILLAGVSSESPK